MTGIRVATVPDRHPYLDAVLPPSVEHVTFTRAEDRAWARSPLFDLAFLREVASRFDVVHVHFGYECLTAQALSSWLEELAFLGKALVVTVHDLHNPHQRDPRPHQEHLSMLMAAAAEVFTLTDGAAAEIEARWSRRAEVVAHPSLLHAHPRVAAPGPAPVIGLHLKSLRTNVLDPAGLVAAMVAGAGEAVVRVDVHPEVVERAELAPIRQAADRSRIDLHVHPRFDDDELNAYLAGLHASVLPYRFGTHSGWLELCRDLGTHVIVPDCGYYGGQWDDAISYVNNERDGLVPATLTAAVQHAAALPRIAPADHQHRLDQLAEARAVHERSYHAVLEHGLVAP